MSPQNVVMARPRNQPKADPAPKKRKYVEVRDIFIPGVKAVAAELGMDDTEVVNFLIREGLERREKWPPKKSA